MKIGAYSRCGTGDFGAQRSENSTNERDRMEDTHKLLPFLISSSNPSEDIEGSEKESLLRMRQLKIAAPLKERDPCVPSARVERVSGFIILTPQRKPFKNFPPKRVKLCKNTWGPVAPSQPSVMKPGINRPPATSFYSRTPVVVSNLIVSQIFGSSGSGIPSLYPPPSNCALSASKLEAALQSRSPGEPVVHPFRMAPYRDSWRQVLNNPQFTQFRHSPG